ncbi:MAG: hypothetical protein A2W25_04690 [candidate division Zixibacteria bacterium RBG_16_53_22]|nr:MAG: hypothetical protein A2W25_04690 [candidate division Zixibacteria bacterium RBG_16_53_22]
MNELVTTHNGEAEQSLGFASLEEVRSRAIRGVESNPELSRWQKRAMTEEINFLTEHERLHRLRRFAFQWIDERLTLRNRLVLKRIELANAIRVSNRQTALQIAQIDKDILSCKLDLIERLKNIQSKGNSVRSAQGILSELEKLQFQRILMKAKENLFHQNLADRTLNRLKFMDKVRKEYPDMADELIEHYDRQVFEQTKRR